MKKIFVAIVAFAIFIFRPVAVMAQDNISDASANISEMDELGRELTIKKMAVKSVLTRYNSPMVESAGDFVDAARENDMDPYLMASISGIESNFGRFIIPDTYNAWGWGQGKIVFENWKDGIYTVSKGMKKSYLNRGVTDLNDIMHIYCPPCDTWAGKVGFFEAQFAAEENRLKTVEKML